MKAALIISVLVVSMVAGVATNAQMLSTNPWPQELQGPTVHGLKSEIYAIWSWNEVGTDVCHGYFFFRQLSSCGEDI